MLRPQCTCCNHVNPAGSRYCIRCGAQLTLQTCPVCTSLNDVLAQSCRNCDAELRASTRAAVAVGAGDSPVSLATAARESDTADALRVRAFRADQGGTPRDSRDAPSLQNSTSAWAGSAPAAFTAPAAVSDTRKPRTRPLLILVLAAVAALIWYAYQQPSLPSGQVPEATQGAGSPPAEVKPSGALSADTEPSQTRPRAESDGAPACSDAVAALGLCAPEPVQRKN